MDQTLISQAPDLAARFPGWVTADTRPGYAGFIVQADHLFDFAKKLRDELGYDYLNSLTGVDYIAENKLEVVYHASSTTGGPWALFKVQVPRDNPVVQSITPIYRGAEFQEREAYDLLGIQ